MFKRLAGITFIAMGLMFLAGSSAPHEAAPAQSQLSFCGACTQDEDCGTDHKCCTSDCTDGKKKCLMVDTCGDETATPTTAN